MNKSQYVDNLPSREKRGQRLSELRRTRGFKTQISLVNHIGKDNAGYHKISKQDLSAFEKGTREPNIDDLCLLADALGCTVDYLVMRENATSHKAEDITKVTGLSEKALNNLILARKSFDYELRRTFDFKYKDTIRNHDLLNDELEANNFIAPRYALTFLSFISNLIEYDNTRNIAIMLRNLAYAKEAIKEKKNELEQLNESANKLDSKQMSNEKLKLYSDIVDHEHQLEEVNDNAQGKLYTLIRSFEDFCNHVLEQGLGKK